MVELFDMEADFIENVLPFKRITHNHDCSRKCEKSKGKMKKCETAEMKNEAALQCNLIAVFEKERLFFEGTVLRNSLILKEIFILVL